MVYALDPDAEGQVLWQQRAGMGGFNGGVHWGMTSDGETVFVGIADTPRHWATVGPPRPGVHAFDAQTGEPVWSTLEPPFCDESKRRCMTAISAPLTATDDLIFAGALNGLIRIYATRTGEVLWTYDTLKPFDTVNGVEAKGGSIDSAAWSSRATGSSSIRAMTNSVIFRVMRFLMFELEDEKGSAAP